MPADDLTLRRTLKPSDRPEIALILQGVRVFRAEEVAIGLELVDESLAPTASTDYRWVIAERSGKVVGFACFGPVPLTEGTYDLYWIAVASAEHGSGIATRLDAEVTESVRAIGGRWLLAETSSTEVYARTHRFYEKHGYQRLERLPDFYRIGDDRLIFGKRMDGAGTVSTNRQ